MSKPRRYRINNSIVVRLRRALEAATMENCDISKECRYEISPFMQAWVEAPLRSALKEITGEEQR